ncbi:MAG: hypothetical protein C0606_17845 [Hyphomicrobiales bacterium]|nr:MAG: hypothetical protein C0606_17845 [Hyphomicrobiales bacterium]
MTLLHAAIAAHTRVFTALERALDGWFLGLAARFVFAGVLLFYFWNSALTKIGSGFPGIFVPQDSAYFQILPSVVEQFNYNVASVPFLPYGIIVYAGTYAEFLLPFLIVVGLFTRLASLGMIGFIVVQSSVDILFHGVDAATIGALFDRVQDAAIMDQRALWIFVLVALVVKGAGAISLDALIGKRFAAAKAS